MAEKGKKVEKSGLWEKIIKKHPGLKKMYPKGFDVYLAGEERRENPQAQPSPWKGYEKLYNEPQRDIANKIRKMVTPVSGYRDR